MKNGDMKCQDTCIDIEKYNLRNYYTEEEYKVLASRLKVKEKLG